MKTKDLFRWFHEQIHNYNLFIPDNDENDQSEDPITMLKQQRYATRLYIPLMIVILYVLFFIALVNPQARAVTISNVTPSRFEQLYREYGQTLSCPCTNITIPYKAFVSTTISFNPVCSSIFVSKQWIEALYLQYASALFVMDFRTTASSQFELLAALCALSQDTISQIMADFDTNQLVTIRLIPESEVQSHIDGNVQFAKTSTSTQIISPLNFLQIITRSDSFISALNTNAMITVWMWTNPPYAVVGPTYYFDKNGSEATAAVSASCDSKSSTVPAGFYIFPYDYSAANHQNWPYYLPHFHPNASVMVDGFFGGCTALDALLESTLDCLYNVECLRIFSDYFPALNQTTLNWTSALSSSNRPRLSVKDSLTNLFIEQWSAQINFSKYFTECASVSCTYTKTDHMNVSYTITLLLSLYGSLTVMLRIIAVFLARIALKMKHHPFRINADDGNVMFIHRKFIQWIQQLNLFKSADNRTANDLQQQRIMTRTYLFLLTSSIIILFIFTSLSTHTVTMTESNPSLSIYQHLQALYPNTVNCLCQNVMIPHGKIMSLSATLHQVCSSDYVSDAWINLIYYLSPFIWGYDLSVSWLAFNFKHFRLLSALCQLANQTITDRRDQFYMQYIITADVLTERVFHAQLNATFNQFIQSLILDFALLVDMVHVSTQVDQPYTLDDNTQLIASMTTNQVNDRSPFHLKFSFTGIQDMNSTSGVCICATHPDCQSLVIANGYNKQPNGWPDYNVSYEVPGMVQGCFTIDTLLLSTLECYYLDACIAVIYALINETKIHHVTDSMWFQIHPLVYKRELSRFPPNTSLLRIIKELMIEQWISSSSFDPYYEACAPIYCTYSYTARAFGMIEIIIKVLSTIGGLSTALRLIIPILIKLIFRLRKLKIQNRQRQDHPILLDRLKQTLRNLVTLLYNTLINLNLFPRRTFGSNIDGMKAKYLGQLATRLFVVLLIISFAILSLYTVIRPQILTKTFLKPTHTEYNSLLHDHSETLQCPCSSISSTFNRFITIEPLFHQICSSPLIIDEWQTNITASLVPDLSTYVDQDYRRFLSAHLQFLAGLCSLSIQSVNNSVSQFLSSDFATAQLLSEKSFSIQINSLVEQSKSNAPAMFTRLFSLLRIINHGNAIVSAYGTNFNYILPWYNLTYSPAITQPLIYDNNCSCALAANCTSQAGFFKTNLSQIFPIKALKMGCTPSESFLLSTLECFYDLTCRNLIQEFLNNTTIIPLLNSTDISRFPINTIINDLVQKLFIENWLTTINYSSYFNQCSPIMCSYTYIQKFNSLYTITILLGLYGGLTFVLKWICPNIIYLLVKISQCRKKQKSLVQPIEMTTINGTSATVTPSNIHNTTIDAKFLPALPASARTQFFDVLMRYVILGMILFILMIVAIIVTSLYLNKERHNYNVIPEKIITNATMIVTTTTTTSPASTKPSCEPKFEPIIFYATEIYSSSFSIGLGDFDRDGYLDVAFTNCSAANVNILLGIGNGTFKTRMTYSTGGFCPLLVVVGDFNKDDCIDLIIANSDSNNIGILMGDCNGRFEVERTLSVRSENMPSSIVTDDYNNDTYLDLAFVSFHSGTIAIFLNEKNGTFGTPTMFCINICFSPLSAVDGDFNRDGYSDLALIGNPDPNDPSDGVVYVLLNDGQGRFDESMTLSVGPSSDPQSVAVGDLNNDGQLDLAVVNSNADNVGIMFGNRDGSFQVQVTFSVGVYSGPVAIVVDDFNNDGQQDVAVTNYNAGNVDILLGIGDGTFLTQITFLTGDSSNPSVIVPGDFNSDGKLDLVVIESYSNNIGILLNTCDCCN